MARWITQAVLENMPEGGGPIAIAGLARMTGLTNHEIVGCVQRLNRRGLVALHKRGIYRLTEAGRAARAAGMRVLSGKAGRRAGPRRVGATFQERIWKALRLGSKGTILDLLEIAGAVHEHRARNHAAKYLSWLARTGYVVVLGRREPGTAPTSPGFQKYILVRNTGPRAPIFRPRKRLIYDPNLDQHRTIDARPDDGQGGVGMAP